MNGVSVRKLLRGVSSLMPDSPNFRVVAGSRITGKFYGATITTVLQSLQDPATGVIHAHEALARSYSATGSGLSPWGLFADASTDAHLIALDRLCRTVHAINFRVSKLSETGSKLVLNVHERLLHGVPAGHGAFFRQVLDLLEMPPARIVIDIPLFETVDVHWLKRVVENYRRAGFRIALEAASALQAKLLSTWMQPDWIRLPPSLVAAETVSELRRIGVKTVATRVDSPQDHARCLEAGVDLVQGFHYGAPLEAI